MSDMFFSMGGNDKAIHEAAVMLYKMYQSFMEAGFSRFEAFELTNTLLKESVSVKKEKEE